MNPIEEMMEKYGVKKVRPCDICDRLAPGDQTGYACIGCNHCGKDELIYPPFTPEKQLEVIKLIASKKICSLTINNYDYNKRSCIYRIFSDHIQGGYIGWFCECNKDFAIALANILTNLFMHLTPTQRQQIKEILER